MMTSEEARVVLSAYPPTRSEEDADEVFVEALEQMRRDPELAQWFEQSRAFDRALTTKIKEIKPPDNLEAAILAQMPAKPGLRRRQPSRWLALAAALVFGGVILLSQFLFNPGRSAFGQFQAETLAMLGAEPMPRLDLHTTDLGKTQRFLDERGAPRLAAVPTSLRAMSTAGCRVFQWRDQTASLTCFQLPDGTLLHLVVIEANVFGEEPLPIGWHSVNGWQIMFERRQNKVVMWASRTPMDEVRRLVGGVSA